MQKTDPSAMSQEHSIQTQIHSKTKVICLFMPFMIINLKIHMISVLFVVIRLKSFNNTKVVGGMVNSMVNKVSSLSPSFTREQTKKKQRANQLVLSFYASKISMVHLAVKLNFFQVILCLLIRTSEISVQELT